MIPSIPSLCVLGGVTLFCASVAPADRRDEIVATPSANAAIVGSASPTDKIYAGGRHGTRVAKDADGLFYVSARVNGVAVRFLIDTGANLVVLTPNDARRVGAQPGKAGSDHVATAAGLSRMHRVTLDRVAIAGRQVEDVDAAVMHQGLSVSLMGQNLLSELGPITISADDIWLTHAR